MTSYCSRPVRLLKICLSLVCTFALASAAWAAGPDTGVFETPVYTPGDAGLDPASVGKPLSIKGLDPTLSAPSAADGSQQPRRAGPLVWVTEFQRFVQAATGRQLPIFGSSFFADAAASSRVPSTESAPVSADYTLGPGDEVIFRAWGSIDANYRTAVDRNGQINLPKVGSITVAGVKVSDLEKHIRGQVGRLYTNFNLSIALGQLRGVKVFVVGPARVPGVYTVSSQSSVLSAVVAAGGPSPTGSMRKVLLRRSGAVLAEIDIYDFLLNGDKSKDLQLINGDVVVFQSSGPRVALNGSLDTPAIYELKAVQEPLGDVLRYAGGRAVLADPNKVLLERIDASKTPAARFVEEFKLDEAGLKKPLRDGDVLTLLPISPQFANAVTLKGHVAQPLRYAFTPGMRIRDLIPTKEALIAPDFYRRKNLLVQAEPVRDMRADALAAQRRGDAMSNTQASDPLISDEDRLVVQRAKKTPAALFDELNWDFAVVERLKPDLSTQVIPFNLGKAILQGDDTNNIELMAGDVVTVFSQKDVQVPVARQTRMVSIEGEVGAPGIYQLQPGETLPQLLRRAGGFTQHAYVYGLEFTREETRRKQRENLDAAISRLEAQTAVQTARDAANKREEGLATDRTGSASAAATRAQISRLSRVQPNGRIALELNPKDSSIDSLPAVPLENGDRIVIPARPGFINVVGAVVNNNALLWREGRSVGEYVKQAGMDESAEPSQMFVLRADGTVMIARDNRSFLGFGGFQSQAVQPGDAIVVPTQLDFETWGRVLVRNLKDFSLILSQFGLGAAAIQTLRNN